MGLLGASSGARLTEGAGSRRGAVLSAGRDWTVDSITGGADFSQAKIVERRATGGATMASGSSTTQGVNTGRVGTGWNSECGGCTVGGAAGPLSATSGAVKPFEPRAVHDSPESREPARWPQPSPHSAQGGNNGSIEIAPRGKQPANASSVAVASDSSGQLRPKIGMMKAPRPYLCEQAVGRLRFT